jgi:cilia- and flagella-associated protein 91
MQASATGSGTSTTTTTTRQRTFVTSERAYDHVYDPVYTVSRSEHARLHQATAINGVKRVPIWKNIFSDVKSHPSTQYRLKASSVQVAPFPPKGRHPRTATYDAEKVVLGADRPKFFRQPIAPFAHAVDPHIVLDPKVLANNAEEHEQAAASQHKQDSSSAANSSTSTSRTVGIQTMYRESEAQTDPYTPDFTLDPTKPEPELLRIAHLGHGNGLPAGMDQIREIQRLREKKEFEDSLPPLSDEASYEYRRKLMEERELAEWKMREEEMKRDQQNRLDILVDRLKRRDEKHQMFLERRIQQLRESKVSERRKLQNATQRRRIKAVRKLQATSKARVYHEAPASRKRDIIAEYADFGSSVYASNTRNGRAPGSNPAVDYGIPLVKSIHGLEALEASLDPSLLDAQDLSRRATETKERNKSQVASEIDHIEKVLQGGSGHHQRQQQDALASIQNRYKRFEAVVRPPTPRALDMSEQQHIEEAAVLLQRLLRGRAVQTMMHQGKDNSMQLIYELRQEHKDECEKAVQVHVAEQQQAAYQGTLWDDMRAEVVRDTEQRQAVWDAHQQELRKEHQQRTAVDMLQGRVMSEALDFIIKEIRRVQQDSRIASLSIEAERIRALCETAERERRREEAALYRRQEVVFQALMQEHQRTGDSEVLRVFETVVQDFANREALDHVVRKEQQAMHSAIEQQVWSGVEEEIETVEDFIQKELWTALGMQDEKAHEEEQQEREVNAVKALMQEFVVPEVTRRRDMQTHKLQQQATVSAAHWAVGEAV